MKAMKGILRVSVFLCFCSGGWVYGFSMSPGYGFYNVPLGHSCIVIFASDSVSEYLSVRLYSPGGDPLLSTPGGSHWEHGVIHSPLGAITQSALLRCGLRDVRDLKQKGADAESFALEDYIGFSFKATDPVSGHAYDYEFALSGVVNTQMIHVARMSDEQAHKHVRHYSGSGMPINSLQTL